MRAARVVWLEAAWDRPCEHCERFVYGPDGGQMTAKAPDPAGGPPVSLPMARPAGMPPPCGVCPKVPKELRDKERDWKKLRSAACDTEGRHRAGIEHFQLCKAVGRFPDDPITDRTAALLAPLHDYLARRPLERMTELLGHLLKR